MGLLTAIKKRLTNQYISVIVVEDACFAKVKKIKNGEVLLEEERRFDLSSREQLSSEVVTWLQTLQDEVEQTYIAVFLNSYGQGVVPSCLKSDYEKFHIDYDEVRDICVDKRYSVYASNIDIQWMEKIFSKTGIDFLFSPFLVIENLIHKEPLKKGIVLYMLAGITSIAVMIFDGKTLLYGTFINIAKEEDLLTTDFEEDEEEDLSDDNIFDEIDLDMELEESADIADILESAEHGIVEKVEKDVEVASAKNRLFGQDLRLVKYFDASLREFYESPLYRSDFVTEVKIYDAVRLNPEIIDYFKEQLLVHVTVESVDILEELIQMARAEAEADA